MKNGRWFVVLALLLALTATVPAMAAGGQGAAHRAQWMQRLAAADTNGDGKVTFEEAKTAFPKATQERFASFDRNGDGVLSREDRTAAGGGQGAGNRAARMQRLKQADANGDGKVTFEEAKVAFPKLTQERFAKFDKNSDGVLSMADRAAAGATQGAGNRAAMMQRLKQADANGDGKLSFEEARPAFPKLTQERFNQMDRNQDGFLSREDRKGAAS